MRTARRAATLALVSGVAAAAAVLAAASGDGGDEAGGDDGWVWGLLLVLAPLLCAGVTRSVAASSLRRPVGGGATVICGLASLVHVAFVLDERGATGWLFGAPAIVTPLLLLVALLAPPDDATSRVEPPPPPPPPPPRAQAIEGPPLDVLTPLREARSHAVAAVVAWFVVLAVTAVVSVPLLGLLGWPRVVATVEAEVTSTEQVGGTTLVTFRADLDGELVRWSRAVEDSQWEVGDRRRLHIDDDGRFHYDQQFGLAGIPVVMPLFLVGTFVVFAVRRLWGLVVAAWDVRNGGDEPRLGYAAVIDDPAPKAYRPLVAVWWDPPSRAPRLAKPDAVYRADGETSEDLESEPTDVVVRRAWIDTGPWAGSKPRWIGFEDGVAVPHRRAVFGRGYVHVVTKRSERGDVVELRHGPPEPFRQAAPPDRDRPRHALVGMVAWRLPLGLVSIALAFTQDRSGFTVRPWARPAPRNRR